MGTFKLGENKNKKMDVGGFGFLFLHISQLTAPKGA
jgi:hypothetical protein